MAVLTPVFADGTIGAVLFGGTNGLVSSLFEWKYYDPENKRSMNNYAIAPQSINNANNPYCTVKGGWDLANPPHSVSTNNPNVASNYNIVRGVNVVLFLAMLTAAQALTAGASYVTSGYLGTFKITGFGAGHSKQNGSDFDFSADQQGAITLLPA